MKQIHYLSRNRTLPVQNPEPTPEELHALLIDAIQDVKGIDIMLMDLRKVEDAPVDYFIVCHGDSNTQVSSIAGNMEKKVREAYGRLPHRTEGMQKGQWVLVDFFDTVVHVFYREARKFYRIEELWSDARVTTYENMA